MNSHDRLVHMANQIVLNFGTMNDVEAAAATAEHIAAFWDPRMKAMILADPTGLSEAARAAIDLLRVPGDHSSHTRATRFNAADDTAHSDPG